MERLMLYAKQFAHSKILGWLISETEAWNVCLVSYRWDKSPSVRSRTWQDGTQNSEGSLPYMKGR